MTSSGFTSKVQRFLRSTMVYCGVLKTQRGNCPTLRFVLQSVLFL